MSDIRRLQTPTEDDLAWLVEAQGHPSDEPRSSAPASREQQHPFDQGLAMLPELTLQQGSVPASAGSTFSAAASSPTALRSQVGNMERQATFPPPVSRLITTGLRTRAQAAEQPGASMEPHARLTRAASESTTGTPGASESPATRGGRPPRARSGTISGVSSVREEAEAAQRASASAQPPESPGIYRSLRKRPNLNYAQAADDPGDEDSESDASSFPMSEEEEKKATTKQAEPKKGQRGRKRRTEPIVVTKEDGTREEVSPQVYRRLRRRVTNRLSARRMRQKRAEEREAIAQETNKLQQENTTLKMRMAELEGANKNLAREAYGWRTRYEQLAQHSGLPSSQHLQSPQQPQQQAQPQQQQQQQQQQGPYVSPGSDRRSHSMPTPQQLPDPLQRSISPGGFDSFSLAADFPSLTMLSPHSQQQQQQQQQPPPSLTRQQLPSYDLSSGLATQRLPGGRSTLGFFPPLPPLQTASPTEIPTPQMDREQLRSSQAGGLYSGGFTHLQSPPFPASPMQAAASQGREAGPSMDRPIMSPRHYSAPNLSQGIGDIYAGPRMLEQRMASQGMAFGQQQQHAIDPGSYGQLGTQLQGSFGQPSQRRSQAARSSAGMKLSERASAPAPLPMGHLGSQPFSSHMPLPDRDTEM